MIVYIALSILKVTKLHLKMSDSSRAAAQHNCIMGTCVCSLGRVRPGFLRHQSGCAPVSLSSKGFC